MLRKVIRFFASKKNRLDWIAELDGANDFWHTVRIMIDDSFCSIINTLKRG